MSSIKEQGDLFWTLTHQDTQSGFFNDFSKFVVVRSFTADSNLLQTDGECEQNTLTRHIFSHLHALITVSHTTLAQDVSPHHVIHASCAVVVLILYDSPFRTFHRLSHLPFHSPDLHLPCRLVRGEVHCALPRMRS